MRESVPVLSRFGTVEHHRSFRRAKLRERRVRDRDVGSKDCENAPTDLLPIPQSTRRSGDGKGGQWVRDQAMEPGELRDPVLRSDQEPDPKVVPGEELRERPGRPEPGPVRSEERARPRELAECFVHQDRSRSRRPIEEPGPVPKIPFGVAWLGDERDLRRTFPLR